jgi:hypothetical protein
MDNAAGDCGAVSEATNFLSYFNDMPDKRQRGKVVCCRDGRAPTLLHRHTARELRSRPGLQTNRNVWRQGADEANQIELALAGQQAFAARLVHLLVLRHVRRPAIHLRMHGHAGRHRSDLRDGRSCARDMQTVRADAQRGIADPVD